MPYFPFQRPLQPDEVDAFLEFLFRDVARRPGPLLLRETASVVRYLRLLAWKGVPKALLKQADASTLQEYHGTAHPEDQQKKRALEDLAHLLWTDLYAWGQIEPATKDVVLGYLERHRETCLGAYERAQDTIRDFEIAPFEANEPSPFRPPERISRSLSVQGLGNPRLQDDLSERIYAASYALKRSKLKRISKLIADVLDKAGIQRRKPDSPWTYASVHERLKEYENSLKRELRNVPAKSSLEDRVRSSREQLTDKWISFFRLYQKAKSR